MSLSFDDLITAIGFLVFNMMQKYGTGKEKLPLPMLDEDLYYRKMGGYIIFNYFHNFKLDSDALVNELHEIYENKGELSDKKRARLQLLLHLSKAAAPGEVVDQIIQSTKEFQILYDYRTSETIQRFLQHHQVRQAWKDVLMQCGKDFNASEFSCPITVSNFELIVYIVFDIKNWCQFPHQTGLFGFSGIGRIYINVTAFDFRANRVAKKVDAETLIIAKELDICAIVAHEITHVLVRSAFDNFDIASPDVLLPPVPENPGMIEAGRQFEIRVFGALPYFIFASAFKLSSKDVKEYRKAIVNDSTLPTIDFSDCSRSVGLNMRAGLECIEIVTFLEFA